MIKEDKKILEKHMRTALALAKRALGRTSPNPAVGALLVARSGRVLSRGYHRAAGLAHAEAEALGAYGRSARGATLFVTLEPCNHHGKTPPCSDLIISSGVSRVVVGAPDPNPLVSGAGIARLRKAGIEVVEGALARECTATNEAYNKFITTGRPFVTLKLAATLDGRIATSTGRSKWISSLESRRLVHRMRSRVDAVLVGSGTAIEDDPRLDVRHVKGVNPTRVVVDSMLKLPTTAGVYAPSTGGLIIFAARGADAERVEAARRMGAE